MGISGLLPFLEKASEKTHISQFKGATVAIDSYCWLHRGAFGCAEKLARGEATNGYILYCMKYIKMLKLNKIRPIMVFDGQHLPAKKLTETKRRKQRRLSKQKAAEMLCLGNAVEARKFLLQSIDITHEMALALIKECRSQGVDCIVAPYEADAQLAYLNILKLADFVISEDSDLLLFGCKKILFKMDVYGHGNMVDANKINDCMKLRPDKFTFDKFRYMCILSGCDYLESIPGIGLKKALKFISVTENPSIYNALSHLTSYLKLSNTVVTDEYKNNFMLADATFKHQLVFDPIKRCLLPLNPITPETNWEHCKNAGLMTDNELAFQLALGNIDPFTHKKVDDWNPDTCSLPIYSIWSKHFSKPKESPTLTRKRPTAILKESVVIAESSTFQTPDSYDSDIENILDIYKKLGPTEKPKVSESTDLYTLIHGDADTSRKRCTSALLKCGPTVVDHENRVHSRFFKPKDEPKTESHEPMVSLLGAIDNLIKKRKNAESDISNTEDLSEVLTKRRKSNAENNCDDVGEDETNVVHIRKKFEFKKEKVQSLKKNVDSLGDSSDIGCSENVMMVQADETNGSEYPEIKQVSSEYNSAETSSVTHKDETNIVLMNKFQFKKEKLRSSKNNINQNTSKQDSSDITSSEGIMQMEMQGNEDYKFTRTQVEKIPYKRKPAEIVSATHKSSHNMARKEYLTKKQSSILRFFGKP